MKSELPVNTKNYNIENIEFREGVENEADTDNK